MNISSNFSVGGLAVRKYENLKGGTFYPLLIMEVITQTCYAGTQVFYLTKAIVVRKKFEKEYLKEGAFEWETEPEHSNKDNGTAWNKHREDELVELTEYQKNAINESKKNIEDD